VWGRGGVYPERGEEGVLRVQERYQWNTCAYKGTGGERYACTKAGSRRGSGWVA
jgi:hypothetical protein